MMQAALLFVLGSHIPAGQFWFVPDATFNPTPLGIQPAFYLWEYPFITMGTACDGIDSAGSCVPKDWKKEGTLYDMYSADPFGNLNSGFPFPAAHLRSDKKFLTKSIIKSYYCEASQWLVDFAAGASMTLSSLTPIITGKLNILSGVSVVFCNSHGYSDMRWAKSMEEEGFAGVLLLMPQTYGITGNTYGDEDIKIPIWLAQMNTYLNAVMFPVTATMFATMFGFSSAFLQFNSTWWDVPYPYLSGAGHFMFAVMCIVQLAILVVALMGLRLLLTSGGLLGSSG